jgi:hypothetical protein
MEKTEIVEFPITWACYHVPRGKDQPALNSVIEKMPLRVKVLPSEDAPIVARLIEGSDLEHGEECGWYRVLRANDDLAALYVSLVPALFPNRREQNGYSEMTPDNPHYLMRGELSDIIGPSMSMKYSDIQRSDVGRVIDSSRDTAIERLIATVDHMRMINGVLYVPSTGPKISSHYDELKITENLRPYSKPTAVDKNTIQQALEKLAPKNFGRSLEIQAEGVFQVDHQWLDFVSSAIDIFYESRGIIVSSRSRFYHIQRELPLRMEVFREFAVREMTHVYPMERDREFFERAKACCEMLFAENMYGLSPLRDRFLTALAGLRDVPGPRPISERIEATGLLRTKAIERIMAGPAR